VTWLVWRQHRNQAYFAAAALAAFAVLLLITGRQLASQYQSARALCAAAHTCGNLANTLTLGSPAVSTVVTVVVVVVPCLLGVFWGGPLVARELETGTSQFAWMQSVTRRRWLAVKVGWALLAAAAWAGAISALATWWSSPANALQQQNFLPSQFDIQGIVPVGYALFAVALGITAGALLRRTLPALAITIGVFAVLRLVIGQDLRSHYLTAVTRTFSFGHLLALPKGSYWLIAQGLVGPGGKIPTTSSPGGGVNLNVSGVSLNVGNMPTACRALVFQAPTKIFPCLTGRGYRGIFVSYQPASRYWAFQGIETGIFVVLAAALLAVTAIVVLRRDA
jgi:hypothetical protein